MEKIFLGLRSIVGVDPDILSPDEKKRADLLVTEGKLKIKNGRYFNENYLLSDELVLFITT